MAFYVPSNTGLSWSTFAVGQYTSWVTHSAVTTNPTASGGGWVTASQLPGATDDVFLFGRSIILDTASINVQSIRSTATGSVTSLGGQISSTQLSHVITASSGIYQGNLTQTMFLFSSATAVNITASILDCSSQTFAAYGLQFNAAGCNASCIFGQVKSGTNGTGWTILLNAGTQTLTLNSDLVTSAASCVYLNSNTQTVRVIGNVTGSGVSAISTSAGNTLNIIVTGSITTTGTAAAISHTGNATTVGSIAVLGNVNAGSSATNGGGISSTTNLSSITITGNVNGGPTSTGITHTGTGNITVTGTVTAGSGAPGIITSQAATLVTVNGKIVNTNGYVGVVSQRLILTASATQAAQWVYQDPLNNNVTFGITAATANPPAVQFVRRGVLNYTPGGLAGTFDVPAIYDVRNTVTYDTGSQGAMVVPSYLDVRTGQNVDSGSGALIMPTEAQVQSGVTFDSGSSKTGSYDGIAAFWGYSTASMTAGSIGGLITQSIDVRIGTITGSIVAELDKTSSISNTIRRIQNAATIHTTGDQISSYNT